MSSIDRTIIRAIAQEDAAHIYHKLRDISDLPLSRETESRLSNGDVALLTAGGVGFVLINFKPRYIPFARLKIPEIQGLSVRKDSRGQGIGKALVMAAENYVLNKGLAVIGLGVGLSNFYGPAQCLYCSMGYKPDGNGIVYDGNPIPQGNSVINDDDLCLMFIKQL